MWRDKSDDTDYMKQVVANGTDLTVGLADDATWEGASSKAENGTDFIANVPTEEVFCAPHRERVNGTVYGRLGVGDIEGILAQYK